MKRIAQNLFIVGFLVFVWIEAAPVEGRVISGIRSAFDPVGDVLGLWQGRWDLFAPLVDKENNRIEAKIYFDGESDPEIWRSPDWNKLSCLGKFRSSREIEFYDRIRNDRDPRVWESFSRYLVSEIGKKGETRKVSKVELISVVEKISPPKRGQSETQEGTMTDSRGYSRVFYTYNVVEP